MELVDKDVIIKFLENLAKDLAKASEVTVGGFDFQQEVIRDMDAERESDSYWKIFKLSGKKEVSIKIAYQIDQDSPSDKPGGE